jgi:NAD(P)-dependent dehydrogenase (short-subunit alcohol dehydrogenase family)
MPNRGFSTVWRSYIPVAAPPWSSDDAYRRGKRELVGVTMKANERVRELCKRENGDGAARQSRCGPRVRRAVATLGPIPPTTPAPGTWIVPALRGKRNAVVTSDAPLRARAALVTGGGRGIGRAIALALARAGATVAVTARSARELDAVVTEVTHAGGRAHAIVADLTDDDAVATLVGRARTVLGGVDLLVHNAGGAPPHGDFARGPIATWDRTLRLNLRAPMLLTHHLLPDLRRGTEPAIVFVASIAGMTGSAGAAAYSAAKFGIRGFAQSLFEEVRELGIRVSVICPGFVDTALIPSNRKIDRARMLRPDDVAAAVLFALRTASTAACAEIVLRPQRSPYMR